MFERWMLQEYAPGEGRAAGAQAEVFDDSGWLPIAAPGDVHRTLLAAGRIEDPFYDRNESRCAWIEDREWWYRLRIDGPGEAPAPDERLLLIFHGLDTYATIWLNGREIGGHRNMFRPAEFDVTALLRCGASNTIAILFDRPLDHVGELPDGETLPRVAMRKAQFGYGWDWGPRLPTVGIWRPVELRRDRRAALRGVHFTTLELTPARDHALVRVRLEVDRFAVQGTVEARIALAGPDGVPAAEAAIALDGAALGDPAYLTVRDPQLWWTHDLGEPARYTLSVTLQQDGLELDRHVSRVGIRTIALDQSPDPEERGTRFFRFVLNGVPLFAKGANWIPADSFVGAIPPERYTMLIAAARGANMNMLRVWGGGIYEHDIFYDECDRLGLLVWQDFMFACAMYPEDAAQAAEVEAEARYQVRRLRSHPSLALWCGNNENQWIHDQRYWDQPAHHLPGDLYYDHTLPRVVAEEDGAVPYWPGSPYGGNDFNSMDDGDRHNWDVWHGMYPRRFGDRPHVDHGPDGVSYLRYAEDMGRFISEFGMHAAPVASTLRTVIPADQRYFHSPSMDWHNKDNPKNKGDNLMATVTGLPDNLEDYIDFSMIAQAEGLKFGIEHYRRRTPHCSGTIVWQLNDCWQVLSWSVLDYYGVGKAGYYYLRRVYAPVLASFKALPDGAVELWLTNDTVRGVSDTLAVAVRGFDGRAIWEAAVHADLAPHSSVPVARWAADALQAGPDRYIGVSSSAGVFPANRHFFAPIKDLRRERPDLEVAKAATDGGTVEVRLRAPAFAYFVHLEAPDVATRFSDNYFDLQPGESRTIAVTNPAGALSPEQITVAWR